MANSKQRRASRPRLKIVGGHERKSLPKVSQFDDVAYGEQKELFLVRHLRRSKSAFDDDATDIRDRHASTLVDGETEVDIVIASSIDGDDWQTKMEFEEDGRILLYDINMRTGERILLKVIDDGKCDN